MFHEEDGTFLDSFKGREAARNANLNQELPHRLLNCINTIISDNTSLPDTSIDNSSGCCGTRHLWFSLCCVE